ncbi:MAG: tetratricopeptide repeat protein [Selenomonadaceae bacterium]|nr:tetratricopeptide repeat protein [Selenomonadaceae bacterium]
MIRNILAYIVFFIFLFSSVTFAQVVHFTGNGSYTAKTNESIKYAQDEALKQAMRDISMQAAAAIRSNYSSNKNVLQDDVVEMVSATVMRIEDKKFAKSITADERIAVKATIKASLDIEKSRKMSADLLKAKTENRKLTDIQEEYATAQSQYSDTKTRYDVLMKQKARNKTREGIKLEREGKLTEALALYNEAIASDSRYARPYSRRAHIYRQQGKKDLAVSEYAKAARIDPKEAGHHYGTAIMAEERGDKKTAAKEYRLFIEYSDILEYDKEIPTVLQKILELEG